MSPVAHNGVKVSKTLVAAAVAAALLSACATAPVKPDGAAEARYKLTQLQSDPNLATRAPAAFKEADAAVRVAEQPEVDKDLAAYRVYLADRKVETAKAQAETSFAVDQRTQLSAQREKARLDARTREADAAKGQIAFARAEGAEQKVAADQARGEANAAHAAAASSEQQAAELQRQIDVLQAKPTDRGLIVTLGDVLFMTGRADLQSGAAGNLGKLVTFLNKYPDRAVVIEGYTDSVGSEDSNQRLSERRADSVKSYLTEQGVSPIRLSASGKGESDPVANNDSSSGRQQNRRVEVIITNPPAASK
jgi:outer membrane protein OmpA-like peptidoglycan-associated protein